MNFKLEVELSSVFQSACQSPQLCIELQQAEATVRGLLLHLSQRYGERMKNVLFEKGKDSMIPGLMVLVNERAYTGVALNQKDVPLSEGDKVSLLYFVSGG